MRTKRLRQWPFAFSRLMIQINLLIFVALNTISEAIPAQQPQPQSRSHLKGIAWLDSTVALNSIQPYLWREKTTNGFKYRGFVAEVLEAIAQKGNFTYSLRYETDFQLQLTDLRARRADFSIANVWTGYMDSYDLNYTRPILVDQHLAALVSRRTAEAYNFCSIEDIVSRLMFQKNSINQTGENQIASSSHRLPPIILAGSGFVDIDQIFQRRNTDPRLDLLATELLEHFNLFYDWENIFLFLKQSLGNIIIRSECGADYMMSINPDEGMVILRDGDHLVQKHWTITLQPDSPHLGRFNGALEQLEADGTMERLREKYWGKIRVCPKVDMKRCKGRYVCR